MVIYVNTRKVFGRSGCDEIIVIIAFYPIKITKFYFLTEVVCFLVISIFVSECSDEEFKGEADIKNEYGTVNISPFSWFDTGIPFPALNITFSNILWRRKF